MSPHLIAGYAIPLVVFAAYRFWLARRKRSLEQEKSRLEQQLAHKHEGSG